MNPILMYHYLGTAPPDAGSHASLYIPAEEFRAQLTTLRSLNVETVTGPGYLAHLNARSRKHVAWLTFDDGHLDNHAVAFPILRELGMRATFFATVDPCLSGQPGFIPPAGLREMHAAGMEIGSHSLSHPRLARLDTIRMRQEVFDSKARLEDCLGAAVASFCYPYGNWSPKVLEAVEEAGYQVAVSTIRGNRNAPGDRWRLKRAMIQPGRVGIRFRYLLSPVYHWLHAWKNRGKWQAKDH